MAAIAGILTALIDVVCRPFRRRHQPVAASASLR
jgi:hypothetical protein